MMARLSSEDIEDTWERLLRLADELGLDTKEWQLTQGELGSPGVPRTTWRITRNGRRLITLGYTKRAANDVLTAVANAYDLLLSEG